MITICASFLLFVCASCAGKNEIIVVDDSLWAEETILNESGKTEMTANEPTSADSIVPEPVSPEVNIPVDTQSEAATVISTDAETQITEAVAYGDRDEVYLDPSWRFADHSLINSGCAVMYRARSGRKNITIGVNAGHGTEGGTAQKTYCHPDETPKTTGGSTKAGSLQAACVSYGMEFDDGTPESAVTLQMARILRDKLIKEGYDVLMIRDGEDVQLDNVARTVICNNAADCHISLHWDGDSLDHDKGVFYASVPDGIKYLDNVAAVWQESERLGESVVSALVSGGCTAYNGGSIDIDLTQTSYSTIPSVDLELGNQASDHSETNLYKMGDMIVDGINHYFN
ncbi:MAG: N-acetylmuramoyl-L-alanine amidase [Clostridia bacterium]|nr:N-acetylmuramoyl-L-alanine amidase [Clostridia bacterium]